MALIDKNGKEIIPPKYNSVYVFSEGLAAVNVGGGHLGMSGKWGFVDKTGKEVIPIKYDKVLYNFQDGKAQVSLGDRTFLIDKTGKEIK